MTLSNTDLYSLSIDHLEALVSGSIPEGRNLDYKRDLPGKSESDKREFLEDVCSLANAGGGDLVFGVDENNGVASSIRGVEIPNPDAEILRLESIILSGLEPRLPGIRSRSIELPDGSQVLLIRVPRSFNRPHAVSQGDRLRFTSRNSRGKYHMDVAEIRGMAVGAEAVTDRVRGFRAQRLGHIKAQVGPAMLRGKGLMALHSLPLSAFDAPAPPQVDLAAADREHYSLLRTIGVTGDAPRYNFDGLVRISRSAGGEPISYAQLFRSGSVELADAYALEDRPDGTPSTIPSVAFEQYLIRSLSSILELQRLLQVEPPMLVTLSLLGVKGYEMSRSERDFNLGVQIDREDLVGPELMLNELDAVANDFQATAGVLRPALDAVWNACGYPRSLNFDADGHWA